MEKELSQFKDSIVGKDKLTLEQARNILQSVVSTHESSIVPGVSLNQVAGFSTEQIREAALLCSLNIIGDYNFEANKKAADGSAKLFIRYDTSGTAWSIGFYEFPRRNEPNDILNANFLLVEPQDEVAKRFSGFLEMKDDKLIKDIRLDKQLIDINDYRVIFKGARLMFANILNWDKRNIILPEQLDRLALKK
jgi:hypothetical protein